LPYSVVIYLDRSFRIKRRIDIDGFTSFEAAERWIEEVRKALPNAEFYISKSNIEAIPPSPAAFLAKLRAGEIRPRTMMG